MTQQQGNVYAPTEVRLDDVRIAGEIDLASRWARLGASLIDGILVAVLAWIVLFFLLTQAFTMLADPQTSIAATLGVNVISGLTGFAIYAAINWFPLNANGQSVGKKLLNIKIVRTDGSPVDARRALFVRLLPMQAAYMIPFIGWIINMIDGLLIFRASKKCLHDDIADTIVIKA